MDPSGYTWLSRAWKWVKKYWQPTAVFGLYGGLKYDEGKQKGYSNLEAWLYAGAQTAIAAIAAYAGTYVVSHVGVMLPFGGFWGGFVSGSAGAYASIFISSFGTNLLSGRGIWDSYWIAQRNAHIGAIVGGVISGIITGLRTTSHKYYKVNDGLELDGNELSEQEVESAFKSQTGYGEGEYKISDITTSAPNGSYVDSDGFFSDGKRRFYGCVEQNFWTGRIKVYISPYSTRDAIFVRGVITHEFQHVIQMNTGLSDYMTFRELERNAIIHELIYYKSLPYSLYAKHKILEMMEICFVALRILR